MARDSKQGKDKKPGQPSSAIGKEAVKSTRILAALAMEGASSLQRLLVFVCYGIILIVIIMLLTPPYELSTQLTAGALGVVFLFAAFVILVRRYKELSQENHTPPPPRPRQQTIQIASVVFERVRAVLEDARKKVYEFLRQKKPSLSDEQIRANIFFPNYGPSEDPSDFMLRIYPGLHLKMTHQPELGIAFKPGQGATGQVFQSGQPRVTQRFESASGEWDAIFDITDELAAIIHPDLKWIISMPLEGEDGKPIGVMNIDGIRDQFHVDLLYECMAKVTDSVVIISKLITEQ